MGDDAFAAFERLDDRFYEYPDDLTQLMRADVSAHRADFHPPSRGSESAV
jgi:hypothetical protein